MASVFIWGGAPDFISLNLPVYPVVCNIADLVWAGAFLLLVIAALKKPRQRAFWH